MYRPTDSLFTLYVGYLLYRERRFESGHRESTPNFRVEEGRKKNKTRPHTSLMMEYATSPRRYIFQHGLLSHQPTTNTHPKKYTPPPPPMVTTLLCLLLLVLCCSFPREMLFPPPKIDATQRVFTKGSAHQEPASNQSKTCLSSILYPAHAAAQKLTILLRAAIDVHARAASRA